MKIKVGDKVRIKKNADKISSALGIADSMWEYFGEVVEVAKLGVNSFYAEGWHWDINWIEPVEKTWEHLDVGDVVIWESLFGGEIHKVLARVNDVVLLSGPDEPCVAGCWYHIKELESDPLCVLPDAETEEEKTINIEGKNFTPTELKKLIKKARE